MLISEPRQAGKTSLLRLLPQEKGGTIVTATYDPNGRVVRADQPFPESQKEVVIRVKWVEYAAWSRGRQFSQEYRQSRSVRV